jgi:hypothetical protein
LHTFSDKKTPPPPGPQSPHPPTSLLRAFTMSVGTRFMRAAGVPGRG